MSPKVCGEGLVRKGGVAPEWVGLRERTLVVGWWPLASRFRKNSCVRLTHAGRDGFSDSDGVAVGRYVRR